MPRRNDRHRGRTLDERVSRPLVVEHELEHAVPVGRAERQLVFALVRGVGGEEGADVRVEHREFELQVVQIVLGLPFSARGVVLEDQRFEGLCDV